MKDGCSGTSWVSADEFAEIFANIYNKPVSGFYNIANGWIIWKQVIVKIIEATGNKASIMIGTRNSKRHAKLKGRILDTSKLKRDFGFHPKKTFDEVIREIL